MNEPSANAMSTAKVVPLFNFHPAVHQLAETRLALAQPSWWRAIIYLALGSSALFLLFLLGDGHRTGRWALAWIGTGAVVVLLLSAWPGVLRGW
jgi:hypothetical protein